MSPEQVRGIVYDILLAVAAVMIPLICTCIAAAWVITKKMVSNPIEDLSAAVTVFGQRVDSFNERLFSLELANNGRMLVQEMKTKHLERGQSNLFDRMRQLEAKQPKEG